MKKNIQAANWINLVLGLWIFMSPWFLSTSQTMIEGSAAIWNFWIVGLAVTLLSGLAISRYHPLEEWANLTLGLWLFFSPFMFFMPSSAFFWNAIIVGLLIASMSYISLPTATRSYQARG